MWGVGIWYIFVWDKSVGIMSFLDMTEWKRLCEIRDEGMKSIKLDIRVWVMILSGDIWFYKIYVSDIRVIDIWVHAM